LAAAGNAAAAGLGKLSVLSSLGEPLRADVALVSVTAAEAGSLKARVAPPQAYAHSNVPYSMTLSDLHVKVEKHANGQPYLRITSTHPYNEPYLDVLLQLNWDGGQITREYTALVNPAGYHEPPAVAAGAPRPAARAATAAPVPQRRTASRARPAAAAATSHAPGTYRVKHGDTLYGIAEATMPTEVTVDQMLIGLYRANPGAFHGNINRMKTGKILRIPSTQQIEQVSASKARREVKLQISNWHAYRNRLATAASRKPVAAAEPGAVSGKISTKVEEAHPAGAATPKDVVRLSKGEAPGSAAGKGESTTERIQALEEEASARQKALDEANSRIAQLEKTISDMRKLIAIKSAGMAGAQQQAQQAAATPTAPATGTAASAATAAGANPSSPASATASASGGTAAPATAGATAATPGTTAVPSGTAAGSNSTGGSNPTTESNPAAGSSATAESNAAGSNPATALTPATPAAAAAGPAAAATAASKPAAATEAAAKESGHGASVAETTGQSAEHHPAAGKAAAKTAKPQAAAAHAAPKHVIPKPAPQPGFFDSLTQNPLYIGIAILIILLLIYFWMRRRRGTGDEGESMLQAAPILAGGAAAATTAAAFSAAKETPPAASPQPAPSTPPSPQPQPAAQAGAISDEVDPLAEAEVYIAYGRDEQAEEILKDALAHHPERTDVQVKLLEVYAARKNTAAFETLAQKVHQSVASDSEEWLKVAALGYTLNPSNPLFEAGKAAAPASAASPASAPEGLDFELDVPTAQTTTDIPLDPAPEYESVSKTGRLTAQFAAAGLEMTGHHDAIAPDFALPEGTRGPEDTQRIADGEKKDADEPAPIPDFTLGQDANRSTGLQFDDADGSGQAHPQAGAGKTLNLEDSQLLMDEALKAARAEPLMPDFQLDLPGHSGKGTDIGSETGTHAGAPDLTLDTGKSADRPLDLALEPGAGTPASGKGTAPTFDLSGINLEFDDEHKSAAASASGAKDGHWHDVQTKFDLAKAYQEMGDRDGAKEILREVVEEGDAEQKAQAKTLLQNLD
jgi:pilus assembly protein FimV